MFPFLFLCVFLKGCDAVIYNLTASEYSQMPPIIQMDDYELCQQDTDALYCMSDYVLVSDQPSPLLNMIQEFSEHHVSHYNHSKLFYGVCVTQTCQEFYNKDTEDLGLTLEACLNKSISEKYNLKVKILEGGYCSPLGKIVKNTDQFDMIVAIICSIILIANIVGSIFDYYCESKVEYRAHRFLLCFSLLNNWKQFTTSGPNFRNPRLKSLESLHGVRVLSMCLVIIAHSLTSVAVLTRNPQFFEELYLLEPIYIFFHGTLIMQTFLILSSFLLVYNWLLHIEKEQITWYMLPKLIIMRWMRLTPSYVIVLALTATWFNYIISGPLWSKIFAGEMNDCRRYWWQNILYINNYFENSQCMVQSWYLAVDMQLFYLGVIIFLSFRTSRSRKIALSLLFVVGMSIPAAHVYLQDLDGILLVYPQMILNLFITDPHFKYIYTRAHTNVPGYVTGMTMGYLIYHWRSQKIDVRKYQKSIYRILYWSLFFLSLGCCYSGRIFYYDAPRQSIWVRMLYAAFLKPIFGLIIAGLIFGFAFRFEGLYRGILEWHGWWRLSRLTYSAYLLHVILVKIYVVMHTKTVDVGIISSVAVGLIILILSFVAALVFWLLVEAPFSNIMKEYLENKKRKHDNELKQTIRKFKLK